MDRDSCSRLSHTLPHPPLPSLSAQVAGIKQCAVRSSDCEGVRAGGVEGGPCGPRGHGEELKFFFYTGTERVVYSSSAVSQSMR